MNNFPIRSCVTAVMLALSACTPKVNLVVSPTVINKGDSIYLRWKTKGRRTLMVDSKKVARPPFDSAEVMEFTLSVQKGKKERYIKRQVTILPSGSYDVLAFPTMGISGDTLVAGGIKDILAWQDYQIVNITSASKRPLIVTHAGKTDTVSDTAASCSWKGLPYADRWEIRSLLTPGEKSDHKKIPSLLMVKALIVASKNKPKNAE